MTMSRFEPIAANDCSTIALAPSPIATIAITAPTPMMIPSAVRNDRSLLRISALPAIADRLHAGHALVFLRVLCLFLRALRDRLRQRLARVLRLLRAVGLNAAVLHADHARREAARCPARASPAGW